MHPINLHLKNQVTRFGQIGREDRPYSKVIPDAEIRPLNRVNSWGTAVAYAAALCMHLLSPVLQRGKRSETRDY
jgi:hypothetical protein